MARSIGPDGPQDLDADRLVPRDREAAVLRASARVRAPGRPRFARPAVAVGAPRRRRSRSKAARSARRDRGSRTRGPCGRLRQARVAAGRPGASRVRLRRRGDVHASSPRGEPESRIARYRHRASMTNAMGLPNPGAEAAATTLRSTPRTSPRLASIADEDLVDVLETHALLEPHVDAVELNASCPNVSWGRDRDNEHHLETLVREAQDVGKCPVVREAPAVPGAIERESCSRSPGSRRAGPTASRVRTRSRCATRGWRPARAGSRAGRCSRGRWRSSRTWPARRAGSCRSTRAVGS